MKEGASPRSRGVEIISRSPEETQRLGARIGLLAVAGDIYLLTGSLGTGKTCLTRGIARGLGIEDYVLSPSFVLVREMKGRLPLYHIDLYRLENIEEIDNLGLDDYLYGNGVSVIEWAEKGLAVLPAEHLLIALSYISATGRRIRFEPEGERYVKIVESISQ